MTDNTWRGYLVIQLTIDLWWIIFAPDYVLAEWLASITGLVLSQIPGALQLLLAGQSWVRFLLICVSTQSQECAWSHYIRLSLTTPNGKLYEFVNQQCQYNLISQLYLLTLSRPRTPFWIMIHFRWYSDACEEELRSGNITHILTVPPPFEHLVTLDIFCEGDDLSQGNPEGHRWQSSKHPAPHVPPGASGH